jgi:hypothetical protein
VTAPAVFLAELAIAFFHGMYGISFMLWLMTQSASLLSGTIILLTP